LDPFLRKLGIELPIIQAPMAGVSTAEMADAVSNAGGVGSVGVGSVDADATRQMVGAVRARTERPFQVNVFCHKSAVEDAARKISWLARLAPEFARYGANSPARLTEIYQSFSLEQGDIGVKLLDVRRWQI
jgi:nitronate monooxygenase